MVDSPQVNFYVEDVDTSVRFYRESFGFTETFRTRQDGRPIHVKLRLGQFTLGLAAIDALREMHGIVTSPGRPRAELVVWADDVDRVHADLAAKGVRTLREPHDFLDSVRTAWGCGPGRQSGADRHAAAAAFRVVTIERPGCSTGKRSGATAPRLPTPMS